MIVELAPAKINLALHVRRRRDDGYHDLETLFAFLRDGDIVRVSKSHKPEFRLSGPFGQMLVGDDNLVTRAAERFADMMGTNRGVSIELEKHLPIASGIGGGSADAAATLRALARLNDMAVDDARLFVIAEGLGADVPACLLGKSAVGEGKGEVLVPMEGVTNMPVLLVNPGVAVSTGAVFRAWDQIDRGPIPQGPLIERAIAGRNDLEPAARAIAPVIKDVVDVLADASGVILARMSGSGATCFALFESISACRDAAEAIRAHHPGWWSMESTLA